MRNTLSAHCTALLAFAACSSDAPPTNGAADDAATPPEDVVVASDTHLVADPPTYPSVPLPEGLAMDNERGRSRVRVARRKTRRHVPHATSRASRSRCGSTDLTRPAART